MDVLMLIASEAEEIQAIGERVVEKEKALEREREQSREREDLGFFATIFPHKPTPPERTISGASSLSAISSRSGKKGGGHWDEGVEEEEGISDESLEETLSVCYALANLCEANERYASRMFQSGLFSITLKLVRSSHIEISRQGKH
ncbi:hypothetical protein B484DRAFT_409440 [Ochromonadaceae sp. CCMP2298]|nr:hypothetical protein B484DRAFT_409440 [Ochromonadaceae sp. CCMP2298]